MADTRNTPQRGTRLATGPQIAYLRRLCDAAFVLGVPVGFDRHHLDRVSFKEASAGIERIKQQIEAANGPAAGVLIAGIGSRIEREAPESTRREK